MKKGVLRNFTNFTGKYLCQSLFFNKLADLRPATLLKKRLWHKCFPVNFTKFLRTPFLQNTSGGCFYFLDIYGSQDIVFEHRVDSRYCETRYSEHLTNSFNEPSSIFLNLFYLTILWYSELFNYFFSLTRQEYLNTTEFILEFLSGQPFEDHKILKTI